MEFNGLTSASHMSLPEAGYGSEEGQLGSEISGAVSGVTTPGASRLQASQLQERSTTMQRLHGSRGNHDSASGISTDTLRSSDFSGAITRSESLRVPREVTFVASPQRTEDHPSECPYCGHRHWPGVHTCADCCVNAPPNLKPGRQSPSSSESGSSSHALPDLEDSSSEGEQSDTGISGDYWENHIQEIWNQEFLNRQNWLLAEASYRGRLRHWFRASCQFIRDSGRLRFDATLQEQEDWEELMDQFDHQAAVMVQMAIIAEERRQNVHPHAGPSGAWCPNDGEVDEMRCDSTHSHLSREQLSKLPSSTSSVDTWVDEVRSKGKGTGCPSCGECAKDCSCRRQISSLEDRVKELKKAAKEKKRDDDSKWKEMEQKLEKLTNLVQNLSTTGLTGPASTMASHPAPISSAAPASTPYGVPHSAAPPAFTGHIPAFTGNSGIPPTGFTSPIGFNLGTEGGESSSERSVLSVGTVADIDGEARTTVKERSMALKKKDKEKKENEAKTKEKQKKLKDMRLHQAQPTPFVQPTVDQALLAAAIAQAQAMGGAAVNPVFCQSGWHIHRFQPEPSAQSVAHEAEGFSNEAAEVLRTPKLLGVLREAVHGLAADGETGQGTLDSRVDGLFDWQTQGK